MNVNANGALVNGRFLMEFKRNTSEPNFSGMVIKVPPIASYVIRGSAIRVGASEANEIVAFHISDTLNIDDRSVLYSIKICAIVKGKCNKNGDCWSREYNASG